VDLVLEAEVEEPVRLVEDEELYVVHVHPLGVRDVIQQTSGSCHHDIGSGA